MTHPADLDEGMIDLPAKITKRGRCRSIPIEPNLQAWLEKTIPLNGIQQGKVCKWGIRRFSMHRDNIFATDEVGSSLPNPDKKR
jgi:hypothetical protein